MIKLGEVDMRLGRQVDYKYVPEAPTRIYKVLSSGSGGLCRAAGVTVMEVLTDIFHEDPLRSE